MKVEQLLYRHHAFIKDEKSEAFSGNGKQLVLAFGAKELLEKNNIYEELKALYPAASLVLCSTSGEIYDDAVYDNSVSAVAIELEKTDIQTRQINISNFNNSFEAGSFLFRELPQDDLTYVLIIADGGLVNGSELVRGIESVNKRNIPVTGGLAGDAANFNYTLVGCNSQPSKGNIAAIGFYGEALQIAHGSIGGWETFGPEKKVTRSNANKLYEIEHKSALETYKTYLGKYADDLPGSALLFPLSVRVEGSQDTVVRTILSIDPVEQSMVFAGDIPEGSYVRFMKANFDKLVEASMSAATATLLQTFHQQPKLALLISCVGRKLILGKRIDEETEAIKDTFGPGTFLTGFYSYGEISPLLPGSACALHNQTMTVTTFDEVC